MLAVKDIFKEFVQYSVGAMFLWLLGAAYKVMRDVRDGPKDLNRRYSKDKQRRMSKMDIKKLPGKHRNSIQGNDNKQESHKNDTTKKRPKKLKRKKTHNLEFSFGCWAVLFFPITLAIICAFLPVGDYLSIFDEVWMRHKFHKLKIIFHEVVYRDPLSHYDWTSYNQTIKVPVDETIHLSALSPKAIKFGEKKIVPKEMHKQKKSKSNVKVYVIDDLLTNAESDKLCWIHNSHVWSMSTYDPITCFDSDKTLDDYMLKVPRKYSRNTPIPGTLCINSSIPGLAGQTTYTSDFFRGESEFSFDLADRIEKASGLFQTHGHSFIVTSQPVKPEHHALKNQIGCLEESHSGQLRRSFASILLFLSDIGKGGHIHFKDLGIKVQPKKGRAIVWTSQSKEGYCDKHASFDISPMENGVMYTLQQWFYPNQFPHIGQRPPEPKVPFRKPTQPYVFCEKAKCQWFDNWNHYAHRSW